MGTQKPKFEVLIPKVKWKAVLFKFVHSIYFESFIIVIIVINMFVFMSYKKRDAFLTEEFT